jgi:hypothetical protein
MILSARLRTILNSERSWWRQYERSLTFDQRRDYRKSRTNEKAPYKIAEIHLTNHRVNVKIGDMKNATHFVGFPDPRRETPTPAYHAAVRVWGEPDILHRCWDVRAQQEIAPGDVVVFAKGSIADPPNPYTFDDSQFF